MKEKIIAALEQIRPFLQRDGGDVEFVDYTEDKTVLVKLKGHCNGCPHAQATIKNGIQSILVDQLGADVVANVEAINF